MKKGTMSYLQPDGTRTTKLETFNQLRDQEKGKFNQKAVQVTDEITGIPNDQYDKDLLASPELK